MFSFVKRTIKIGLIGNAILGVIVGILGLFGIIQVSFQ